MMKSFVLSLAVILCAGALVTAQQKEEPLQTAKAFIRQGDYNNAVLVLNRALQNDAKNPELKKNLAFTYYLQRDYARSMGVIKPLVEGDGADVQSYQIMGMIYKATEERKEAEKLYRNGLKRFPESGALYNEYGEMLWASKEFAGAAKQWQKGIQADPNYSGNYYNAAKYYYLSADKIWGLLYGEIFINLESYSKRTPEIKSLLLEGYKKLFAETDLSKNQEVKNIFVKDFLSVMKNQSQAISAGVTPESLSTLRTRFVLEWFNRWAPQFPFRLFDYHQQLAKEGLFDAYNQWIFGAANDLTAFQQWTITHSEEYERFNNFQKRRVFKLPRGQYYHPAK